MCGSDTPDRPTILSKWKFSSIGWSQRRNKGNPMNKTTHDYYARSHHDHDHTHDHDHDDHAPVNEHDNGPPGEYEIMSRAMQELLEQKGLITAEQVAKRMEQFDEEFPYRGAQVVARAWVD